MKTFIAFAIAALMGLRADGEQSRTANNPCVDTRNPNPRLLPVDEAAAKPDFFQYRARLQMAVERHDVDGVIEASDPGIRLGFDASGGATALRKLFTDRSESWDELRVVLARGGRFSAPASFAAPYRRRTPCGRTSSLAMGARALFNLIDGRWRMTAFVAGD